MLYEVITCMVFDWFVAWGELEFYSVGTILWGVNNNRAIRFWKNIRKATYFDKSNLYFFLVV